MALVDVHGGGVRYLLGPAVHPRLVAPGIAGVQIVDLRGDIRPGGGVEGEGVGLAHIGAVGLENGILIGIVALEAGDEDLPDAALDLLHGGGLEVPVVEVRPLFWRGGSRSSARHGRSGRRKRPGALKTGRWG